MCHRDSCFCNPQGLTVLFSPSLSDGALGISRRETAEARGADAVHGMLEWRSPLAEKPSVAAFFATRSKLEPGTLTRRVLFTGNFWMTEEPVAAWRPVVLSDDQKRNFRSIGSLHSQLLEKGQLPPAAPKAKSFAELSLEPLPGEVGLELQSLQKLAGLELRVEVVRFSKPAADASGVSTGRVLAVSENYAAQQIGAAHVVVHENKNLSRPLSAGENATLSYEGGRASVFDGIAHDINIEASWMPKDQQAYLRMAMFDALSAMTAPQSDDERLRDAMRYALESTANFFGLHETKLRRADIKLVVNEKAVAVKPEGGESRPSAARRP
jgi:hypothetical protein